MSFSARTSPRLQNGAPARPDSRPQSRSRMRAVGSDETPPSSLEGASTPSPPPAEHSSPPPSVRFKSCEHSSAVLIALNDLRVRRELCDITLRVDSEEREVCAHRAVLSANSPYFRAMFSSRYAESAKSVVDLGGVTAGALEAVIDYFYTSKMNISTGNVQAIMSAASMLQVCALKDACSEFMKRHLGVSNCLGVWAFADAHSCPQLRKLADNFTKEHFQDVVKSEDFLKLEVGPVMELFSSSDLNVQSEECVYEAVMGWIKHDPVEREKYMADLLEEVRLPLIHPEYLCDHVSKEELLQQHPRAMKLLLEAMEYHLLPDRRSSAQNSRTSSRKIGHRSKVLVAIGGMGRREPTSSVEQFDPHSKQWKGLSNMGTSRWGAGSTTLDNIVYVVGGSNEFSRLKTVEVYDIIQDQWSAVAEMSLARNGVGVVTCGGLIYAIGGFDGVTPLSSAETYDPNTNKWSPLPDMGCKRFGLGACSMGGLIYAIGGSDGTILNSAECYNPSTNSWSTITQMQVSRKFPGVVTLNEMVYAVGGRDASAKHVSVERYSPSLDQWTLVTPLLTPRSGPGTAVVDGFIFVAGGTDGISPLSSAERYDPLTNTWSQLPSMTTGRDSVGLTVVEVVKKSKSRIGIESPVISNGSV